MLTLKNLSLTAADAQGRADIVKNVSLDAVSYTHLTLPTIA